MTKLIIWPTSHIKLIAFDHIKRLAALRCESLAPWSVDPGTSFTEPGPRLNIMIVFPRYDDTHVKDKTDELKKSRSISWLFNRNTRSNTNFYFKISPWIKSISNESDITFQVLASQLSDHCDVISNRLWNNQQNANRVSATRGRCVKIGDLSSFPDSLYHVTK